MVKVFPAETLGPGYIKAIKAPLPQVKLMPTGGVDLKTIDAYRKAGADGFGVGSPLFDRARVEAGDWNWVEAQCRAFVEAYSSSV
jgi:2-dehydro-3-deoxyphosphogluconate aldolase / (4S)-4-hydroxy-2-oxoglutarate aldolase